jgi:electron transport complex protein RnfG
VKELLPKLAITLFIVGAIAAAALGFTYAVTNKRIALEDKQAEAKASIAAIPSLKSPSELKAEPQLTAAAKKKVPEVSKIYSSSKGDIIIIQGKGYGGVLENAVGISPDGKVIAVSNISNKETAGLGSKTLDPAFLDKFKGKSINDKLKVGEDVQAVTGATISSTAMTGQVKEALEAYKIITGGSGGAN